MTLFIPPCYQQRSLLSARLKLTMQSTDILALLCESISISQTDIICLTDVERISALSGVYVGDFFR